MTYRPTEPRSARPGQGDRFDGVKRTSRVGAHRAVEHPGQRGAWLLLSMLVALILTALGILIYTLQPSSVSFMNQLDPGRGSSGGFNRQAEAEIDESTTVVVLNGTRIEPLAFEVDEVINAEGWGTTLFAGNAQERDIQISAIFYANPEDEGLARGLGENLGGISSYLNPNYETHGNQLTVLLGTDYSGPGLEEAQAEALGEPGEGE